MTTTTPNPAVDTHAPVVLRLLADLPPAVNDELIAAGWSPVLPDDGTPTWIRTTRGGDGDALAR